MSKKNRQKRRADAATKTPKKKQIPFVARPFEGLAGEQDLVAMMQILPAATMVVRLNAEHGGGDIRLVTLLPELAQALKRADGEVLVAMQTSMHSGDASRDVAAALLENPSALSERFTRILPRHYANVRRILAETRGNGQAPSDATVWKRILEVSRG